MCYPAFSFVKARGRQGTAFRTPPNGGARRVKGVEAKPRPDATADMEAEMARPDSNDEDEVAPGLLLVPDATAPDAVERGPRRAAHDVNARRRSAARR